MHNPLRHPDDVEPWPIALTLGGPISARNHIGHIDEFHGVLAATGPQQVGAYLPGDRRQGKTSLLNLVEEYLRQDDDVRVLRFSAETSSPEVLGGRLAEAIRAQTWLGREAERWALDLEVSYKGFRLRREGGKRARTEGTDDLLIAAARKAAPRRLIVIIDEIAVFAQELKKQEAGHATEFLHTLRRARQEGADNLSVVLSGSTGLHHVIPGMQPVNDLRPLRVGRLTDDHAIFLARCLLLGSAVDTRESEAVAARLAAAADGGAFYIHHLTSALEREGRAIGPDDVDPLLEELLRDPDDPMDFKHYERRLEPYYGSDASLAGQILDEVALHPPALSTDDVVTSVASAIGEPPDRAVVADLVGRLEQDHYLAPTETGSGFASELLRRAWIIIRRLER